MTTMPAVLAEIVRGPLVESVIRGHVAAVDGEGRLIAGAGDPRVVLPVRSTVKPLQALSFVARALDRLASPGSERLLAIACASHMGEPEHVGAVRELLRRAGVSEDELRCGVHPPSDSAARSVLAGAGETPKSIHNNCSGKHAAMLATCAAQGWPLDGYMEPNHVAQQAVRSTILEECGLDLDRHPFGIDGCGLPAYGLPLQVVAGAFATAAAGSTLFARCAAAMADHPHLISGTRRLDSEFLRVVGEHMVCKVGGAACWVAVRRDGSGAVAVKLEAGDDHALGAVALAVVDQLGWLPASLPEGLERFRQPSLRNWAGLEVGATHATVRLTHPSRLVSPTS